MCGWAAWGEEAVRFQFDGAEKLLLLRSFWAVFDSLPLYFRALYIRWCVFSWYDGDGVEAACPGHTRAAACRMQTV